MASYFGDYLCVVLILSRAAVVTCQLAIILFATGIILTLLITIRVFLLL